jgi:hypothetical protein
MSAPLITSNPLRDNYNGKSFSFSSREMMTAVMVLAHRIHRTCVDGASFGRCLQVARMRVTQSNLIPALYSGPVTLTFVKRDGTVRTGIFSKVQEFYSSAPGIKGGGGNRGFNPRVHIMVVEYVPETGEFQWRMLRKESIIRAKMSKVRVPEVRFQEAA